MSAGKAIVLGCKYASTEGPDPERGKVGSGDQLHSYAFRLPAERKAHGIRETAKHLRENFIVSLEIPEHGMRDGVAAPIAAVVAPTHGEQHELLGFLDGKESQQNLIEQCENSGVRADAQRKSQD